MVFKNFQVQQHHLGQSDAHLLKLFALNILLVVYKNDTLKCSDLFPLISILLKQLQDFLIVHQKFWQKNGFLIKKMCIGITADIFWIIFPLFKTNAQLDGFII